MPVLPTAFFLLVILTMLQGCSHTTDIPSWIDLIERKPVKTVVVQGHRLAYLDEGQGEGPPVILIHGFGGSMWQWEYQQQALAASHRVITVDLLGSGLSDKPDIAYTPEEFLTSFTGFMDALGIERAALAGNSMGGGVATAMALTHPNRVDRLILIAGFPDHVKEKLTSKMTRRALDTWAPIWLVKLGSWFAGRGMTETVLEEMVYDHSRLTPAVIERSYRNRQRPGIIPAIMKTGRSLPLWEEGFARRLGEVRQPVLIIWGDKDAVFPPQVGRDLQKSIPGSALEVIPDAGHLPQWERPELVNPLILKFLR
jgi:pimeloyl-ACP methyl ester carboxylesterase